MSLETRAGPCGWTTPEIPRFPDPGAMHLRCAPPRLVWPVRVESGPGTPTRAQARGPHWRRTGHGLYVPARTERFVEQRILEEWSRVPGSVVTGWAACRLYGAAYLDGRDLRGKDLPVPLVIPPDRSARASRGSRIVRQHLAESDRARRHGITVPVPGRAIVELARSTPDEEEAVVAVEMAYAAGVALPEWVEDALVTSPPRGRRRVEHVLSQACTRSCSPPESRLRRVCLGLGWEPSVNTEVFDLDGRFLARPDLLDVERGLAIEYDGAPHRSRERHRHDNERLHLLRQAGLEVVTIVGGGVVGERGRAEAARMLREAAALASRPRERRWTTVRPPGAHVWLTEVEILRARYAAHQTRAFQGA